MDPDDLSDLGSDIDEDDGCVECERPALSKRDPLQIAVSCGAILL